MKAILQAVGEDTLSFGDQCYYVTDNVKRFLNNFQPGMEVDVTVKDVEGYPQVTFVKKAGFALPAGRPAAGPAYGQRPQSSGGSYPPRQAPTASAPKSSPPSDNGLYALTAVIALAYQIPEDRIAETARQIKKLINTPPAPPQQPVVTPPPQPAAPPMPAQAPVEYGEDPY